MKTPFSITPIVQTIQNLLESNPSLTRAEASIAAERFDSPAVLQTQTAFRSMLDAAENEMQRTDRVNDFPITTAGKELASMAAISAFNPTAGRRVPTHGPVTSILSGGGKRMAVEVFHQPGEFEVAERSFANENFDTRDNQAIMTLSLVYNLGVATRGMLADNWYPTVAVPPDQTHVSIVSHLLYVQRNNEHAVTGAQYDLKRRLIWRAEADPTILANDSNLVVPVHSSQSAAAFIAASTLPTRQVVVDGQTITTSALRFSDTPVSLLGLSQSAIVGQAANNQTDTLEQGTELENVYLSAASQVLRLPTMHLPGYRFVPTIDGRTKTTNLIFRTTTLGIRADALSATGVALTGALAAIANLGITVFLRFSVTGTLELDTSNIALTPTAVSVVRIVDNSSNLEIALADASVSALVTAINAGSLIGYDVRARRSNLNRRLTGLFVDPDYFIENHPIPNQSPVTTRAPATNSTDPQGAEVSNLIYATRLMMKVEAVTTILRAVDMLSTYVDSRDPSGESPPILGAGRHYVRPRFIQETFDATTDVSYTNTTDIPDAIRGALVSKIQDMAMKLYQDSELSVAVTNLFPNESVKPKLLIATDQYTASWLQINGEIRTLGPIIEFLITDTIDTRLRNRIILGFSVAGQGTENTVVPINNGNMFLAPDVVLIANITRTGQYSREAIVQPRYLYVQHLPVLGVLEVSNLSLAVSNKPFRVVDVTPTP